MGQEVSISYQAVKSRVYRLIDALVEGAKTEEDVQESVRRWWKLVHPADRPMAQKYLDSRPTEIQRYFGGNQRQSRRAEASSRPNRRKST